MLKTNCKMMKKILLYGAGDFGLLVMNLLKITGHTFAGFVSDIKKGNDIIGDFNYVQNNYDINEYELAITIGYGDLKNRFTIYEKVLNTGYKLPNIIHPDSRIDPSVKLGNGNIIMAGTDIDFNSTISDLVVLWPGTVISHDSKINTNIFISPNSTVCGYAEIGSNTFIGAGSIIVDRAVIPQNSFLKAGTIYKTNITK